MVIVLMGVCGCGKTTVGKAMSDQLGWPFYDADEFHSAANVAKMEAGQPLTDEDRLPWLQDMANSIDRWTQQRQDAILACSALKSSYRQMLREGQPEIQFVFLTGDQALLEQRMANRKDHYMPAQLLESQLETLEEPVDALVMDFDQPADQIARAICQALNIQRGANEF